MWIFVLASIVALVVLVFLLKNMPRHQSIIDGGTPRDGGTQLDGVKNVRGLDLAIAKELQIHDYYSDDWIYKIPHYSTELNSMFKLNNELKKRGIVLGVKSGPLTHALTAYKALTGKEWR